MKHAKPVTYSAWGIEYERDGRAVLLHSYFDDAHPAIIDARAHVRRFLRVAKENGRVPKSARVVKLRVTVKVEG